jgi:type I restriction-modification system DNA methylase subunit
MFDNATLRALPGQLFYGTQIPVCLWFLAKNKNAEAERGLTPNQVPANSRSVPAKRNLTANDIP